MPWTESDRTDVDVEATSLPALLSAQVARTPNSVTLMFGDLLPNTVPKVEVLLLPLAEGATSYWGAY